MIWVIVVLLILAFIYYIRSKTSNTLKKISEEDMNRIFEKQIVIDETDNTELSDYFEKNIY